MDVEIDEFASQDSEALVVKKLKHNEDAVAKNFENCTTVMGSTSESLNSENLNGTNSDPLYHNDADADDPVDEGEDVSDYDDNDDYMYDDDDDDYLSMQARFDNVDLPPGVEASVSWLNDPTSSTNTPVSTSISTMSDAVGQLAGTGMSSSKFYNPASIKKGTDVTSHSMMLAESSSAGREQEEKEDEVMIKFHLFKRFDTVDDFSDHHFSRMGISGQQPPKSWTKKVQDDWKILEKDLPDAIYVRVYESRMDLLRAVIVGPAGTPYHDGLFVFDVHFPPTYPDVPPMVYYYSGGLRLNPNLYDCGKVCLSLLNTWSGNKNEMWMPKTSTMLQVLVSIQALILNTNPFFNEPGYAEMYRGQDGERRSKAYNEDVFILSLKTMMYTLRRPPKHFEDFVAGHFRLRGHSILSACRAYMEGAEVGSASRERAPDASGNNPMEFKAAVGRMMRSLVTNFIKNGSEDCEQFRTTA
ncbi:putative ubiquitin-conjugating enzyme E2 38 [Actinidia eriantha]|uniref:putative ubiquitin-conjugating enzyme E2 38 n=1 Tax=Actinidia eriantha TaxID=165200 RepID=UPI0025837FE1|nr:putative ubiquitin-conjugating enzyme E2 38 [Actinidia eriantha]XP_057505634.1 putative ubiquitin-conjugating enzyme E2 38 [Actinidia eriantha]XP_057505635.1 putative ubiquitin-conjugating enzyme E2 38 [Actinidia eriantha]